MRTLLSFAMLLGLFLPASANAPAPEETKAFRLEFGPWNKAKADDERSRVVELHLSNYLFGMCVERKKGHQSNLLSACSFVTLNDDGEAIVDHAYATRKLYHDSGMNVDGSPRRFYHRWFGID